VKKVTMDQIAKEIGVSKATVSYALSGKNVSEEIRQKVLDVAEGMGYQPRQVAPELLQDKRWKIILAMDYDDRSLVTSIYRNEVIRGIKSRFLEEDYEICLSFVPSIPLKVNGNEVDGVISLFDQNEMKNGKELAQIPVVFIGADTNSQDYFEVDADGVGAGYQAAAWILSQSPEKILFITNKEWPNWASQYKRGFQMAPEEVSDRKIDMRELTLEEPIDLISSLSGDAFFDFIILPSDIQVLELMHHPQFVESTLIAMKRFEGYQTRAEKNPASIFPAFTIGEKAADLLMGVIKGERLSRHSIIITCSFQNASS
jgi:transcriptional regulator with XRE-family HTH domain